MQYRELKNCTFEQVTQSGCGTAQVSKCTFIVLLDESVLYGYEFFNELQQNLELKLQIYHCLCNGTQNWSSYFKLY